MACARVCAVWFHSALPSLAHPLILCTESCEQPMPEVVTIETIEGDARALVKLATPPEDEPNDTSAYAFKLSRNARSIHDYTDVWVKSLVKEAHLLDNDIRKVLQEWILVKKETFENALKDKVALHFDILVVGLVSTLMCFVPNSAEASLVPAQLPINPITLAHNLRKSFGLESIVSGTPENTF